MSGRVHIDDSHYRIPVGGDPGAIGDRGPRGYPGAHPGAPQGPSPHEIALLQELRALRSEVHALRTEPRTTWLERLPPRSVDAYFRISIAAYVNTAGTRTILTQFRVPQGLAFVVTRLKPVYFTSETDQLSPVSNDYALIGTSTGGPTHHLEIFTDGGSPGQLGGQGPSTNFLFTGLAIQQDIVALLGWSMNHYAAYVRGGGEFKVTSVVQSVIAAGAGNIIPSHMGVEVGGFFCPESTVKEAIGQE